MKVASAFCPLSSQTRRHGDVAHGQMEDVEPKRQVWSSPYLMPGKSCASSSSLSAEIKLKYLL